MRLFNGVKPVFINYYILMLAVIKTGGKQYPVQVGETLSVEKLAVAKKGDKIIFDQVLLVVDDKNQVNVGQPMLAKATVEASLVKNYKTKKVDVLKYKNKTRYRKRFGHRQQQTEVKIEKIIL